MRTGLVKFEKLSLSWICLVKALDFEVLHAYVTVRIKEVIEVQIFFQGFFLWLLRIFVVI